MQPKKKSLNGLCVIAALSVILFFNVAYAQTDTVPDTENCLYCHRYPHMGRYDKDGTKRIFYVNETLYANSVHGKLRCKSCHVGLDKIPHTDVNKVDCSTKCHIEEPSTNKEFSHINMINKFQASVHGTGSEENPKAFSEDLPTCKYCHDNRIYNPFMSMWGKSEALSNETLTRCMGCHTEKQWSERFFSHFTHRMRRRRSQAEIIALCTSCHEDREKMERHGLETIETYKDTFHWALVKYQVENAPDCISCHVPVGYSTHHIRPKTDPTSPVNMVNRVATCSNQGGLQICHPGATAEFANGRVHAYGLKVQIKAGEGTVNVEDSAKALVVERADADIPEEEVSHYKILKLIRLFYQTLIAFVVGSMFVHQTLDYYRARKRHRDHP